MAITRFIEQSNKAGTLDVLIPLFMDALIPLGYDAWCCFSIHGLQLDMETSAAGTAAPHYNKDFVKHYQDHGYLEIDPVYKLFWHARGPFTWDQVLELPLNAKQKEVMKARKDAGILVGIGIPIQSADPSIVGMSVKSSRAGARTDKDAIAELYAVCNQFHLQRAMLASRQQPLSLPEINLTPREKEMLQWCSQGKSNNVIATILGISEKTVEFHFGSIFKKLEVSSRTTAVLKASHLKLVHIDPVQLKEH